MSDLLAALASATGATVADTSPVSGGSINSAFRVTLSDGRRIFVKHHPDAPAGSFRAEAEGLAWLAAANALRTPAVVAVGEGPGPRFLALEWIEAGPGGPAAQEAFGRGPRRAAPVRGARLRPRPGQRDRRAAPGQHPLRHVAGVLRAAAADGDGAPGG